MAPEDGETSSNRVGVVGLALTAGAWLAFLVGSLALTRRGYFAPVEHFLFEAGMFALPIGLVVSGVALRMDGRRGCAWCGLVAGAGLGVVVVLEFVWLGRIVERLGS